MIQHVLLESRLLLFLAWIAGQLVIIALWSWRRSQTTHRGVWIGLAALPLLMTLSTLVVTQREQVTAACHELARHVERGDRNQMRTMLSDSFVVADLDRDAFVERAGAALLHSPIKKLKLKRFEFGVETDNRATVAFSATCQVRTTDAFFDRVPSRWELGFKRTDDGWKVSSIKAIPMPFSPVRSLDDWLHGASRNR